MVKALKMMRWRRRLKKYFISEIDQLLQHYRATYPRSQSQQQEIEKHERIASKRDGK